MSAAISWWKLKSDADCKNLIGKLVYKPYKPAQCGKIVDCWLDQYKNSRGKGVGGKWVPRAKILWLKTKQTSIQNLWGMGDLEKLVDDHERKLKTHKNRIKELKKL